MPASPLSADGDENSTADECSFDSVSEVVILNALSVVNLLLSIFPTEFTAHAGCVGQCSRACLIKGCTAASIERSSGVGEFLFLAEIGSVAVARSASGRASGPFDLRSSERAPASSYEDFFNGPPLVFQLRETDRCSCNASLSSRCEMPSNFLASSSLSLPPALTRPSLHHALVIRL